MKVMWPRNILRNAEGRAFYAFVQDQGANLLQEQFQIGICEFFRLLQR
jgi:hypothetical protein